MNDTNLPQPSPEAFVFSDTLKHHITEKIAAAGGWIPFADFMALALYAPAMGYYSGGAQKFGAAGDFITAPEISATFGQTLATQAVQVMALSAPFIIEVGAGSGRLAADLLLELEQRKSLPERYSILELSGELRERQRATISKAAPHLINCVQWLDQLPTQFSGLVLANELLDAMPVHLVHWTEMGILERGVAFQNDQFVWQEQAAGGDLLAHAEKLHAENPLSPNYLSEINLAAAHWTAAWGNILRKGVLLLIDYGFPRHEYYHPQRSSGTLMCHYRHHSHGEPFYLPGLQDITAHVDFTAIVEAGFEAGLDFLGYTTQATLLLNCGITEVLARTPDTASSAYLAQARAVQKLISPAEMGELFKVMALGKGISDTLIGFAQGDRSASL